MNGCYSITTAKKVNPTKARCADRDVEQARQRGAIVCTTLLDKEAQFYSRSGSVSI